MVDVWRAQIRSVVIEAAHVWLDHRELELMLGLLPSAALWPIRADLWEYEVEALTAVRTVVGEPAKAVIRVVQSWDREIDLATAAQQLAHEAAADGELRRALTTLNDHFQVVPLFADAIARSVVNEQGGGNVHQYTDQIRAAVVNMGGELKIDALQLNITSNTHQDLRDRRNQLILLNRVQEIWVDGVLQNALHLQNLIALTREDRSTLIEDPRTKVLATLDGAQRPIDPNRPIYELCQELGYAMLILGAPGAGKTTTLIELAQAAAERAAQEPGHPIPVLFNLSSWNTSYKSLADWLAEELSAVYQIPERIGQQWVADDTLMVLLDGLDEVAPHVREACVRAINAFRVDHALAYLVVCSRSQEYVDLMGPLRLHGAVELQALTDEQVDGYLTAAGLPMAGVRTALQHDASLRDLASTPLMLNFMALAYADLAPETLLDDSLNSVEARRQHLFATYVERMLGRRRAADAVYEEGQVKQWLSMLASQLQRHQHSLFLMEQIQTTWLLNAWKQRLLKLVAHDPFTWSWATFGRWFAMWLISAAVGFYIFWDPYYDLFFPLFFGALLGVFGAVFLASFHIGYRVQIFRFLYNPVQPVERLSWSFSAVRRNIDKAFDRFNENSAKAGAAFTIAFACLAIRLCSQVSELMVSGYEDLILGIIVFPIVIILALLFLIGGIEYGRIETKLAPNQGMRRSLGNAILGGMISALIIGGLTWWLMNSIWGSFVGAITGGLVAVLTAVIVSLTTGGRAWFKHMILRWLIARNGYLPLRLVPFLEYGVDHLFLQRVGSGYMFIHRSLQEYFATQQTLSDDETDLQLGDWLNLIDMSRWDVDELQRVKGGQMVASSMGGLVSAAGLFSQLNEQDKAQRAQAARAFVTFGVTSGELMEVLAEGFHEGQNEALVFLLNTYQAAAEHIMTRYHPHDRDLSEIIGLIYEKPSALNEAAIEKLRTMWHEGDALLRFTIEVLLNKGGVQLEAS